MRGGGGVGGCTPRGITEKNCTGSWYSSSRKRLKAWHKQRIFFFWWKIEIYFIEWTPSVISGVAAPLMKILPMMFTRWDKFLSFTGEKNQKFCLLHAFNSFWEELYQNPEHFFPLFPVAYPSRTAAHYNITSSTRNARKMTSYFHLVVRPRSNFKLKCD